MERTAMIFDIQRFSVHDGPGIRTTVFFKGCNLRCLWCHNPESIEGAMEIQSYPQKCIGCGRCVALCEHGAMREEAGARVFDRARCVRCGACTRECYAGALVRAGERKSVEQVLETVLRDEPFYRNSGGGMTCSGGEPMLQVDFLERLLAAAKRAGLHTAVDTAGNVPFEHFERVLPYTDLFLYDIKAVTPELHLRYTGQPNERIAENVRRLGEAGARVWVRVPVVPGVAGEPEEMRLIAERVAGARVELTELLNYHRLGGGKYESLGKRYALPDAAPLTPSQMEALAQIFREQGLAVRLGS